MPRQLNCFLFLPFAKLQRFIYVQVLFFIGGVVTAQEENPNKRFEVYGYIKTDLGYNFDQIDPNWFDVLRVTKLPQYPDQFAPDGKLYFSVRETRLGMNSWLPTSLGQFRFNFEFDLFGVGTEVGKTTFHFRQAFVEIGRFSIGHSLSLFTDPDITPITLDLGAPPSRPFLRSINIRFTQVMTNSRWGVALEQPGATSDEGVYTDRIAIYNIKTAFKLPNLSAQYRRIINNGYVELAGVVQWIRWENTVASPIDLSGEEIGWGFYISSTYRINSKTTFKGQLVYGEGIENYLTDAGPDIGIEDNPGNPITPILGVALPVFGGLAFLEHNWNSKWSSTIGYSGIRICNSDAQAGNAFRQGRYGILNLLYRPVNPFMIGVELQLGQRINYSDGFGSSAIKVQFSCKYNFSHCISSK